jgi:hypothetical protein
MQAGKMVMHAERRRFSPSTEASAVRAAKFQ